MVKGITTFKSLKSLFAHAEKKIQASLADNVAKKAKSVMKEEIKDKVYNVYTPTQYQRQYTRGGLIDEANIETKVKGKVLSIENVRSDGNKNVAYIVETGEGYTMKNPPSVLTEGREFTAATRQRMASGEAVDSLREGLHQRGLDVRKK